MIKTKIVATLGPASSDPEMIGRLIEAGVDVFRMNFSHGTVADHEMLLGAIRQAQRESGRMTAVMGDLCGPKIRTAVIEGEEEVKEGDRVEILRGDEPGRGNRFGTNYSSLIDDAAADDRIMIDDGQIQLRVVEVGSDSLGCEVVYGGRIKSHKGINLPDSTLTTPSITQRDWGFVDWAREHELDFLALSFVRAAHDVETLKGYLGDRKTDMQVVAKIETPQAIDDLEAIVRAADAVLVARGDLGVEMDLAEVPILQKRMTHLCRELDKPVIVATQMLQSMIHSPAATRAEVSDVANAVMDTSDAVMLSGETAVGQYPVEAVRVMGHIAEVTESWLERADYAAWARLEFGAGQEVAESFILAAGRIVEQVGARLMAIWDEGGCRAPLVSKARIDVPTAAFSSQERVCTRWALSYGLIPRLAEKPSSAAEFVGLAEQAARECGCGSGDRIVVLSPAELDGERRSDQLIVHQLD